MENGTVQTALRDCTRLGRHLKRSQTMSGRIAFLRGINVGGKNRLSMAELQKTLENAGYTGVKTWLNSGNLCFSDRDDAEPASARLEHLIHETFGLRIPVLVLAEQELAAVLSQAPDWWDSGNPDTYDNLIFVIPPLTASEVVSKIGEARAGLERIREVCGAIFWSFDRKNYQKTNWWHKTAQEPVKDSLTIRNARTVKKILSLCRSL